MPLLDRFFTGDKELGKKDDDHRPGVSAALPSSWAPRQSMLAFRRRRYFFALLVILFIYLFIKNIPSDIGPNSQRGDIRVPLRRLSAQSAASALPSGEPPHPDKPSEAEKYYFSGPIKFYKLAMSLHAVAGLAGHNGANKNVLFAASSLRSASEILPLACEMATWKRNDVHFALMGRDDLEVAEIMRLNGVNTECDIHWHDARPDYAQWSSNFRMEVSVSAGMGHIQTFVHPQVIITDHESREDAFFTKAVRAKAAGIGKSVIELPLAAAENLMWITRLDSGSLAAWHTTYVDLVIHAPPKSSGTLIRLLKSIESADYFGARRPHLTIELPAEIDPATADYLENLVWPPLDWSGAPHASQVKIRHRMPRHSPTAGEASSHFIESFYPARPKDSHVLLISPQAELSSIYYHYVMYHLLEYKYSTFGGRTHDAKNLMGFTLELPSTYLNDSTPLEPPVLEPDHVKRSSREALEPTPFLWQAPNSNAALYFGEKWVELHSFLSARMYIQDPRRPVDQRPPPRTKVVSESYPSWMEYFQELMRVRGYFLLYPHFPDSDDAIVTIHEELRQSPQEFSKEPSPPSNADPPKLDPNEPFVIDPSAFDPILPPSPEAPLLVKNLIALLPYSGDLPQITKLPILSHEGNILSRPDAIAATHQFANEFRNEIGRCNGNGKVLVEPMGVKDLFCNLDQSRRTGPVTIKSKDGTAVKHNKNTKEEVDDAHNEEEGEEEEEEDQEKEKPKLAHEKKSEKQMRSEFDAHLQRQAGKAGDSVAHATNKKAAEKGINEAEVKKSSYSDTTETDKDRPNKAEITTSKATETKAVRKGTDIDSEPTRKQQKQDTTDQAPLTPFGGESTKKEEEKSAEKGSQEQQQPNSAKKNDDGKKESRKEDSDKPRPKLSKDVVEKPQAEDRKPGW